MLKGQTIIELTDISTGEVKVVKEDNFVTNAIRDLSQPILRNQDTLINACFRGEGTMTTEALMRGLFLFDTTLGENANNYFPGLESKMVGHGGDITYAGSDLTLGSFNVSQSDTTSPNERTYVWDFTAEQANGIINSVCLTTQIGGLIGYGTKNKPERNILKPFSNIIRGLLRVRTQLDTSPAVRMPVYLNFKDDYILFFDLAKYQTGELKFRKTHLHSKSLDIFKSFGNIASSDATLRNLNYVGYGYTENEEVSIPFPEGINTSGTVLGMAQDGKYLYLTETQNNTESAEVNAWAPGSEIKIVKIDLELLTAEVFTVTNTTGVTLAMRVSSSNFTSGCYTFGVSNNYLFARNWVQTGGLEVAELYAISLIDNTDVKKVENGVGKTTLVGVASPTSSTPFLMTIQGAIAFANDTPRPNVAHSNDFYTCVSTLDFIAKYYNTAMPSLFAQGVLYGSYGQYAKIFPTDNKLYYCIEERNHEGAASETSITLIAHPNVLMTINNLQSPVEKTPAQTMRITYKIMKE